MISAKLMHRFSEPPKEWDVFISHANEDKDEIARPLANALQSAGVRVWYDEFSPKLGDRLRDSIDQGLANSRYGIVVLSHSFFAKHWSTEELNALAAKEVNGEKVILPIWHKITAEDVRKLSPMLAGRIAGDSSRGLDELVRKILEVVRPNDLTPPTNLGSQASKSSMRFWSTWKIWLPIGILIIVLGIIGFWPQLRPESRPNYFSGPIAGIYDNLDLRDQKKLGGFVKQPYLYSGPLASRPGIGPGTTFVRFVNGVAIYFKFDQDTNPGSGGGRSFFIEANGDVKHWWLAKHYPRESSCWLGERPAGSPDRCQIVPACLEPHSGIGSVWRCEAAIQSGLGRPTMCEANFIIQIQEFEHGFLITNVPMFASTVCLPTAKLVQTESYVLFKDDVKVVGNVVMQGSGYQIRSGDVDVQTSDQWPIWTCTEAASQLCKQEHFPSDTKLGKIGTESVVTNHGKRDNSQRDQRTPKAEASIDVSKIDENKFISKAKSSFWGNVTLAVPIGQLRCIDNPDKTQSPWDWAWTTCDKVLSNVTCGQEVRAVEQGANGISREFQVFVLCQIKSQKVELTNVKSRQYNYPPH